ncbi:hypothetical protein, partial [Alistipes shahii]|uniref:hypothetical protein n=1 Tax=Alistipes shahii TaxID=328814 RepID=UPI003FD833A1
LTDTSITTILAPEMTYTPVFMGFTVHDVAEKIRVRAFARRFGREHDKALAHGQRQQNISFHTKVLNNGESKSAPACG